MTHLFLLFLLNYLIILDIKNVEAPHYAVSLYLCYFISLGPTFSAVSHIPLMYVLPLTERYQAFCECSIHSVVRDNCFDIRMKY
jgi:hypothetical protein